jgi:hypothetical protein
MAAMRAARKIAWKKRLDTRDRVSVDPLFFH